jgi:polyferredoxin
MTSQAREREKRYWVDKLARKLVQIGFLLLFLYPFIPVINRHFTQETTPTFSSWLLLWDPLLLVGQVLKRNWLVMVVGAPLVLLATSFVFGRSFCGWICPLGTLSDMVSCLAFWRKTKKGKLKARRNITRRNLWLRYYLLAMIIAGSVLSLHFLGLVDPLVIFSRGATSLVLNIFSLQNAGLRMYLTIFSFIFIAIIGLELWQPRFWCRNLCLLGALISLVSRWSVLNRQVNTACSSCGECVRSCPMRAIPREPHNTDYSDCTFCLDCSGTCPQDGISFNFGTLAGKRWQKKEVDAGTSLQERRKGGYIPNAVKLPIANLTRSQLLKGTAAIVAGCAIIPLSDLAPRRMLIRPPGALPEDEFLKTCILCQECVRVCPTGGLKPTFLEGGLAAIGTPQLLPRQGGCSINPSCPNLCAKVCPVGAILPIRKEQLKVGLARVDHSLCLAWDQGVKCLVCVEACLNNAAQAYQGRVTVNPNNCTGCGRCESGCPVVGSAIRVYPLDYL